MKKNGARHGHINEDVMRSVSAIIRSEVKDPRISPITSVTGVEVTNDLKTAKIYVSVLGRDEDLTQTIEGLRHSAGFIRGQLARRLNLRNTPELKFLPDSSIAYGLMMSQKIDEVIAADHPVPDKSVGLEEEKIESEF